MGSMGPVTSLNASASSEPPDMHGKACYGRGRATREYMAEVQRVRVATAPTAPQQAEAAPERGSMMEGAKKKGRAAMKVVADGARAAYNVVAVYVGRAPGWTGPVANARPANTPVGTPPPVTAYAPETKPAVLDGSAAPIAASATDALPLRRASGAAAKPAKAIASREDDDTAADPAPKTKAAAKHAKVTHHHRHSRTAEARHGGKHKRVAAAKPLAEGDGADKPVKAKAHSGRRPEGE
jgi:D-alanyl-D-alanine carboxypeptidase